MKTNPSLMFSGACGDAFRRYASLFGGEIVLMLTYGESPAKSQVPDDWHKRMWFARLRAGGLDITGGDLASSEKPSGFSMAYAASRQPRVAVAGLRHRVRVCDRGEAEPPRTVVRPFEQNLGVR